MTTGFRSSNTVIALFSLSIHSLNAQIKHVDCSNSGTNANALGNCSTASGINSLAFGQYTTANASQVFVIGTGSSLTIGYQQELIASTSQEPLLTLKDDKVGILNSNPTVTLDVTGNIKAEKIDINRLAIGDRIEFSQSSLSFAKVANLGGGDEGGVIVVDPEETEKNSKEGEKNISIQYILTMKGANVGIGTTNPTSKFHVSGTSSFNGPLLVKSSTNYQDEADIAINDRWFFTSAAADHIGHNWRVNKSAPTDMARAQSGTASAIFFDAGGNIRFRTAPNGTASTSIALSSIKEVVMANNGNFGIGTDNPVEQMQIGNVWTFHNGGTKYIGRNVKYEGEQNKRIVDGYASCIAFSENGSISLEAGGYGTRNSQVNTSGKKLVITADGNIGIGTDNTEGYKLAIDGKMICEKAVVKLSEDWPDYVFDNDYDLKELSKVETFIQENKHLPEIPSAEQIKKTGVDLAEMNTLLLKKVEELTLYIIDLQKQVDKLKGE